MSMDEELFESLHKDLDICRDYIKQIAIGMIKGGVSKYPIFIATRGDIDIDLGVPIINRSDFDISWSLNASHLEDFVLKAVVEKDNVDEFIKAYKNPMDFMCVFVAEDGNESFVFMPYERHRELLN
jgi:hypothetical protein